MISEVDKPKVIGRTMKSGESLVSPRKAKPTSPVILIKPKEPRNSRKNGQCATSKRPGVALKKVPDAKHKKKEHNAVMVCTRTARTFKFNKQKRRRSQIKEKSPDTQPKKSQPSSSIKRLISQSIVKHQHNKEENTQQEQEKMKEQETKKKSLKDNNEAIRRRNAHSAKAKSEELHKTPWGLDQRLLSPAGQVEKLNNIKEIRSKKTPREKLHQAGRLGIGLDLFRTLKVPKHKPEPEAVRKVPKDPDPHIREYIKIKKQKKTEDRKVEILEEIVKQAEREKALIQLDKKQKGLVKSAPKKKKRTKQKKNVLACNEVLNLAKRPRQLLVPEHCEEAGPPYTARTENRLKHPETVKKELSTESLKILPTPSIEFSASPAYTMNGFTSDEEPHSPDYPTPQSSASNSNSSILQPLSSSDSSLLGQSLPTFTDKHQLPKVSLDKFSAKTPWGAQAPPSPPLYEQETTFILKEEIARFLQITSFNKKEPAVDPTLDLIYIYIRELSFLILPREEEFLDQVNTPFEPDPLQVLRSLQKSQLRQFSKPPQFELLIDPQISDILKIKLDPKSVTCKGIYLQMVFDCLNEGLNYIRPYGILGIPPLWSEKTIQLIGEPSASEVLQKLVTTMTQWWSIQAGFIETYRTDTLELSTLRDQRMSSLLCSNVAEEEHTWVDYEDEATQVKFDVVDLIIELLTQEVVTVLSNR